MATLTSLLQQLGDEECCPADLASFRFWQYISSALAYIEHRQPLATLTCHGFDVELLPEHCEERWLVKPSCITFSTVASVMDYFDEHIDTTEEEMMTWPPLRASLSIVLPGDIFLNGTLMMHLHLFPVHQMVCVCWSDFD